MGMLRSYRQYLGLALAFVGPVVLGAALVPFRATFANTAAALTMVALVALVAVVGNRGAGVVASASAAAWFDFFLTRPYLRFSIDRRPDLETTICIFVVGVFITELAGRSRHHWQKSNESVSYVSTIHDIAELAAGNASVATILDQASKSLISILDLRSCRFETQMADPPLARIESNGEVVHVGVHWPAHEMGIPGPEAEIVAQSRGRVVGRFVVSPTPGAPVSWERRIVAVSLVDVVAANILDLDHET